MAIASLIINAYKRRSVVTAQDADVAPAIVGVTYLRLMNMKNKNGMCFRCSPQAHLRMAVNKSLFTCHCSVEATLWILWNAILARTKHGNTESEVLLSCANVILVMVKTTCLLFSLNASRLHIVL